MRPKNPEEELAKRGIKFAEPGAKEGAPAAAPGTGTGTGTPRRPVSQVVTRLSMFRSVYVSQCHTSVLYALCSIEH